MAPSKGLLNENRAWQIIYYIWHLPPKTV